MGRELGTCQTALKQAARGLGLSDLLRSGALQTFFGVCHGDSHFRGCACKLSGLNCNLKTFGLSHSDRVRLELQFLFVCRVSWQLDVYDNQK